MNRLSLVLSHVAILSTPLATAFSQDLAVSNEEEEIFELSPFTISSSEETGYRAKHSLDGTRMKLSLDDISTPMDIITMEMMDDFNITRQEDLFNIVSNMEERDDSFLSGVYESGASYRIRGFVGVKSLRNFAASNMTFDSYNSTRFVATKGPNSILFGSGPGGGSVSFFTKRYGLGGRDSTTFKTSIDSYGSHRGELNLNRALIEDKWGVNVSLFTEKKEYEVEPSYENRNGIYINTVFRPFENTVVSASYETRAEHTYRPGSDYTTLVDYHTTWEGYDMPAVLSTTIPSNRRVQLQLADGTVIGPNADTDLAKWGMARDASARRMIIDGELVGYTVGAITDRVPASAATANQRSFPAYAWPRHLGPTGLNSGAEVGGEAFDINIEQKVTDDLYLMLAAGKSDMTRLMIPNRVRELRRDPNYYAPDGVTVNPHFGEYYSDMQIGGLYNNTGNDAETVTLTAAYELDLEERNKYLGKHNIALMHSQESVLNYNVREGMLLTETPDGPYSFTNYADAINKLYVRHYMGDDLSNLTAADMMPDYRYTYWDGYEQDGYRWEVVQGAGSGSHRRIDTDSNMFVLQSNFFRSRLITNLGYRTEDVDQFVVNFGQNPAMGNLYTAYEHFTKEQSEDPDYVRVLTNDVVPTSMPSVPWESISGLSKNQGLIFKITPDIALVGNRSQNISGSPGRVGVFGIPLPNESGRSEDYGIRFNLFEEKLRFEYTRYKTSVTNQAVQATGGSIRVPFTNAQDLWAMMIQAGSGERDVFAGGENWDTRDFVSRGHEVTVTGDPVRGLNLRLAVSYNEKVSSNIGGSFMPWWNAHVDEIRAFVAANPTAINLEDDDTTPDSAQTHWDNALNTLSLREDLEGQPEINSPLWTAKFIAKYRFQDGLLKGHEAGLNYSWKGKQKSQYFKLDNGTAGGESDLDRPFYTDDWQTTNIFWNYSKKIKIAERDVKWKIQFNVNNVFNEDTTLERNFYNTIYGDEDSPVIATSLRSSPGRVASLTNTFSF